MSEFTPMATGKVTLKVKSAASLRANPKITREVTTRIK
jgi:hypothetical protein